MPTYFFHGQTPEARRRVLPGYPKNFVFKSYQNLIKKKYYKNKSVLSFFLNYPRFLGPREAIFSAICRQNIGCNYLVIGRDHSGIGKKYDSNILKKLFPN